MLFTTSFDLLEDRHNGSEQRVKDGHQYISLRRDGWAETCDHDTIWMSIWQIRCDSFRPLLITPHGGGLFPYVNSINSHQPYWVFPNQTGRRPNAVALTDISLAADLSGF